MLLTTEPSNSPAPFNLNHSKNSYLFLFSTFLPFVALTLKSDPHASFTSTLPSEPNHLPLNAITWAIEFQHMDLGGNYMSQTIIDVYYWMIERVLGNKVTKSIADLRRSFLPASVFWNFLRKQVCLFVWKGELGNSYLWSSLTLRNRGRKITSVRPDWA